MKGLLFLLLPVLWCVSCAGPEPPEEPAVPDPTPPSVPGSWYLLEDGVPASVAYADLQRTLEDEDPDTPWTVQIRPVGFIEAGGSLWIGINRRGFLRVLQDPEEGLRFPAFFDREIFGGRTLGALFTLEDAVGFHIYVNQILGGGDPALPLENLFFLEDNPGGFVPLPSGRNPEFWELTDIIPGAGGWNLLWRGCGDFRERVEYERRARLDGPGTPISAAEFRSGYDFIPLKDTPSVYREAYQAVCDHYGSSPVLMHIFEDSPGPGGRSRRYYTAGDIDGVAEEGTAFLTLPAVHTGGRHYLLVPELSAVFIGGSKGAAEVLDLPPPGSGASYTLLWPLSGGLLLSWEQKSFVRTGRSGLLYLPLETSR